MEGGACRRRRPGSRMPGSPERCRRLPTSHVSPRTLPPRPIPCTPLFPPLPAPLCSPHPPPRQCVATPPFQCLLPRSVLQLLAALPSLRHLAVDRLDIRDDNLVSWRVGRVCVRACACCEEVRACVRACGQAGVGGRGQGHREGGLPCHGTTRTHTHRLGPREGRLLATHLAARDVKGRGCQAGTGCGTASAPR